MRNFGFSMVVPLICCCCASVAILSLGIYANNSNSECNVEKSSGSVCTKGCSTEDCCIEVSVKGEKMGEIVKVNKDNFDEMVLKSDKPVFVDFWAEWCEPCKVMTPILETFSEEHQEVKVVSVNIDTEQDLAIQYKIISIPAIFTFVNGEIIGRQTGIASEEKLQEMLNKAIGNN